MRDVPVPEAVSEGVSTYIPGVAAVKFSEEFAAALEEGGIDAVETKGGGVQRMISVLGVSSIQRIVPDAGRFEDRTRRAGLHRWYEVHYTSELPATKAALDYSDLPGVDCFEPVSRAKLTGFFNDPMLDQQWNYYNSKNGVDVNVVPVWDEFTTGNQDVIVAVVDGGIDYNHEDLAGQVILADSYNFLYNNSYVTPHNHGTHVAGTIAAINNNGKGVSGLAGGDAKAGNKGVRLISCQVFEAIPGDDEHDKSTSSIGFGNAIKWAADHGAVICNNSWSTTYETEEDAKNGYTSSFFKECVDYFNANAGMDELGNQVGPMAGGLVVFAAGNDTWQYAHPCDYEGVLAVGAVDETGGRAFYSNYGDWVDICAPGGAQTKQLILSTIADNRYELYQGTSMACPHVVGVAALVVSECGGPGFTREMLIQRLLNGANKTAIQSSYKIGNLVSAYGAIAYGQNLAPATVVDIQTQVKSNFVTLEWPLGVSASGKKAYGYKVMIADSEDAFASLNPAAIPAGIKVIDVRKRELAAGSTLSATFNGLKFSTDYYAAIVGYDINGNYSAVSAVKHVTTGVNHAPVIDVTFDHTELKSFETVKIPFGITDEDGHAFTYKIEGDSKVVYFQTDAFKGEEIVIAATKADPGVHVATLVAEDEFGASSSRDLTFTVLPNSAPAVVGTQENVIFDGKGKKLTIDLSALITDADGEDLTFKADVSASSVLHLTVVGTDLNLTSIALGTVKVSVSATDAKGEQAVLSFDVLVRDPSEEIQTFPNPVKDRLGIRLRDAATVSVKISNRSGAVVFSAEGVAIDPFHPYYVDMKGFPGGVYYVSIAGAGEDKVFTVVKR